jgi:hypothetical protein
MNELDFAYLWLVADRGWIEANTAYWSAMLDMMREEG